MAKSKKVVGTQEADRFPGTEGNDIYFGEGGNDLLFGLGGQDNCNGGKGNDLVDGGDGDDEVNGGAGNDRLRGGQGNDVINGNAGRDRILGGDGADTIDGGSGNDLINAGLGDDTVEGNSGNDKIFGGDGADTITDLSGVDTIFGGAGDDNISSGSGNDSIDGGDGNDFVSGDTGNDLMLGGLGDDTLDWDDGDGNDIMSGNDGRDTIEVDGSVTRGDNFVLGKNAEGKAFFQRIGLDGQLVNTTNGGFTLTVDTAEVFDVSGEAGNDTFVINDLVGTGVEVIEFAGGDGNDSIDARNSKIRIVADGGAGSDILTGGTGTITVTNASNVAVTLGDTLTGGADADKFQFLNDPFANGNPAQNLNQPDVVTDFEQTQDQLVFGGQQFGVNALKFQRGNVTQLVGDSNLLVLEGSFANAGLAAAAIRDNANLTGGRGFFVYNNSTLGFSRVVFSTDLANGGPFSVQANLTNLQDATLQANFSATNFALA